MEVECSRHPGASTIGSYFLEETAPWLANPGIPAMSPHAEGKKGTCHSDTIYTVETREGGGGNNPETMVEHRTPLQQTQGIHVHVDNRRTLTVQACQC